MNLRVRGSTPFLLAAAVLLAACADEAGQTLGPRTETEAASPPPTVQPALSVHLHCTADVRAGRLSCGDSEPGSGASDGVGTLAKPGNLIVGSQGTLVRLRSLNVCFEDECIGGTSGSGIFQAEVTVENLMGQALATADGMTAHPAGVRVFFVSEPRVTQGSGTVTVVKGDGTAAFTESHQPYIQYGGEGWETLLGDDGILSTEEVSLPRIWQWLVSAGVEAFDFKVAVSAVVANTEALGRVRSRGGLIAASSNHTCALAEDGTAYCWGSNGRGQLGTDDEVSSTVPVPVQGGHTFTWISVNNSTSCGVRIDGKVLCWGERLNGVIGDGNTAGNALVPHEVDSDEDFVFVSVGRGHACALTTDGRAFCWGNNEYGQLGDGTTTIRRTRPVAVEQGDLVFAELVSAQSHTCGLTIDGRVYCWGSNENGKLGIGTDVEIEKSPVEVSGGRTFRTLISNGYQFSCAIAISGATYCWGAGENYGLGTGDTEDRAVPTEVTGGKPEFASVGGSTNHACAITVGGAAYCWGHDPVAYGHLGTGKGADAPAPALVAGGLTFSSISVGHIYSCGITADGAAYCWGANTSGHMGIGTSGGTFLEPVPVSAPAGVVFKTTR